MMHFALTLIVLSAIGLQLEEQLEVREQSQSSMPVAKEDVLGLRKYRVSRTPEIRLNMAEEEWEAAFPDYSLRSLRGGKGRLSVILQQDGEFAVSIEIGVVDFADEVPLAIESQFSDLSAPLTQLQRLKSSNLDMLAIFSKADSLAVAARGLVLANVKTEGGASASQIAQTAMDLIFEVPR